MLSNMDVINIEDYSPEIDCLFDRIIECQMLDLVFEEIRGTIIRMQPDALHAMVKMKNSNHVGHHVKTN